MADQMMMATLYLGAWLAAATGIGIVAARIAGRVDETTTVIGASVGMLGAFALLFGAV